MTISHFTTFQGPQLDISSTSGAEPSITTLSDGRYVVVWSSGGAVRAQIFNGDGTTSGSEILGISGATSPLEATAASLTGGGFVITWTDHTGSSGTDTDQSAVHAQVYDASGVATGAELYLNHFSVNAQYEHDVAGLLDGGFVATWSDTSGATGDTDGAGVHYRTFDADGTPRNIFELRANTDPSNFQGIASIAVLENGTFVITWTDQATTGGIDDGSASIRARIFNADGTPVGAQFLANTTLPAAQLNSDIAALPGGRFVITWQDLSLTGGDTSSYAIRAQVFEADGAMFGPELLVNTATVNAQETPTVTSLADGRFVIAWDDNSVPVPDSNGIKAQIFNSDGVSLGTEFLVNTTTFGAQDLPDITALPNGNFVVAWRTELAGGGSGINTQMFASPTIEVINEDVTTGRFVAPNSVLAVLEDGSITAIGETAIQGTGDGGAQVVINGTVSSFSFDGTPAVLLDAVDATGDGGYLLSVTQGGLIQANGFGAAVRFGGSFNLLDNAGTILGSVELGDGGGAYYSTSTGIVDGVVIGGTGSDVMIGGAQTDYFDGFSGNDSMVGADGADFIYGDLGEDTLRGGAGEDELGSGSNSDVVYGGSGNDTIDGGSGSDLIFGDSGSDSIIGGSAFDTIFGGSGDDTINSGANGDTVYAGSGDDSVLGDSGGDMLSGGSGNDTVLGGTGNDTISGSNGEDLLEGGDDDDELRGGADSDTLLGQDGDDELLAGSGDDFVEGGAGGDVIRGESGDDTINGGDGNDNIDGGSGEENINGDDGDDAIFARSGDDLARGGNGNDTVAGGAGDDTISGSNGDDSLSGGSGGDTIYGGADNDIVQGTVGNDYLNGGSGDDTVEGGSDNDTLDGSSGQDLLSGGNGADVFIFDAETDSTHGATRDTITDFTVGEDMIDLSGFSSALTFIGASSYSGTAGEVRYNGAVGRLYIDLDGDSGSDFSVDLTGLPAFTADDLIL